MRNFGIALVLAASAMAGCHNQNGNDEGDSGDSGGSGDHVVSSGGTGSAPDAQLLVNYPMVQTGGDFIDRGFYVEAYPGSTLQEVHLWFSSFLAGDYTIELTVRDSTYDGALIGTSTATVTLTSNSSGNVETTFLFDNLPVTSGNIVTFQMSIQSGPSGGDAYYAVVGYESSNPIVTETNGTSPSLDTFRRDGVAVVILGQP